MAYIKEGSLQDRRRGADGTIKLINFITALCFLLGIAAVIFLANASPSMDSMISTFAGTTFDKAQRVEIVGGYRMNWMRPFLGTLFLISVLSGLGLYLKSKRLKRKRDNYYVSLVFFCILSTISFFVFLFLIR